MCRMCRMCRLIGDDRQNLRRVLVVAGSPSDRKICWPQMLAREQHLIPKTLLTRLHTKFINSTRMTIWPSDDGIASHAHDVIPVCFSEEFQPITVAKPTIHQDRNAVHIRSQPARGSRRAARCNIRLKRCGVVTPGDANTRQLSAMARLPKWP